MKKIVFVDGEVLYKTVKERGMRFTQLFRMIPEECEIKDKDYISRSARKGKMSLDIARRVEEILGITIISQYPVANKQSARRRLTAKEREQVVECMLVNKTPAETAKKIRSRIETVQKIYDSENYQDFLAREAYKEKKRKKAPDIIRTGSGLMYRGRK